MSMLEYRCDGIGFYTQNVTEEQMLRFIKEYEHLIPEIRDKQLAEAIAEILEEREKTDEPGDLLDDIRDATHTMTYSEFIEQVMDVALEGIELNAIGVDEDGKEGIYFERSYPWQATPRERQMSRHELEDKLKVFADIFEVPVEEVEFEFCS